MVAGSHIYVDYDRRASSGTFVTRTKVVDWLQNELLAGSRLELVAGLLRVEPGVPGRFFLIKNKSIKT